MSKSYYDLLDLPRTASADDIKRAFRREIAKYHPDKVQHLGKEFQEIAVVKAAELTQAYKALGDPASRADYDASLEGEMPPPVASAPPAPPPEPAAAVRREPQVQPEPAAPSPGTSVFAQERAGATDLIRRATIARFRTALDGEFGRYEEPSLPGFEVVCVPKPAFFSLRLPPRVLARFVPEVTGAAIADAWGLAVRMKKDPQRDLCVFVLGPRVGPASELALAISEQRRKPMPAGGKLVMIPTSTQNWSAHVPTDAPPVVKSLLSRLKSA